MTVVPENTIQAKTAVLSGGLARRYAADNGECPRNVGRFGAKVNEFEAVARTQTSIAGASEQRQEFKPRGDSERVNRHCPSVDVLFDSVAAQGARNAVGVLLTGMGADGAKGLLNLQDNGAMTIAQDEESCVVYGMPKVAVQLGAAQHRSPPGGVPGIALQGLQHRNERRTSAISTR